MNLGNLLQQGGGVAETGRPVRFQIRVKAKDGKTSRVWADAVLLPVSETERAASNAAAAEYCAGKKDAPALGDEQVYRFLQKSLRNPDSLAAQFVLSDQIDAFRSGVTLEQTAWLQREYKQLIRSEYSELLTVEDEQKLEQQAEDFTGGGRP